MFGRYLDDDGDEQKLYAEVLVPDTEEECDDDFGYDELQADIIKQAKEAGINEGRLIFPGKPFAWRNEKTHRISKTETMRVIPFRLISDGSSTGFILLVESR